MKEKQEKVSASGISAAYVFSWPVFILSFGWMFYALFEVDIFLFTAIFTFLGDSSGFLTFLCIVVIAMSLLRKQKQYRLAVLNAVNIVLLNQLYLNSKWQTLYAEVKEFFSELNWTNVFFFGTMLAVAGYCTYTGLKQHRKIRSQKTGAEPQQASGGTVSSEQGAMPQESDGSGGSASSEPEQASGPQCGPNSPVQPGSTGQSNDREMASAGSVLIIACFAVIIVFVGKLLIFDVWTLARLPESLSVIAGTLPVFSVLATGIILAPAIYKIFRSIGKTFQPDSFRATALLALLLEFGFILAVMLNGGEQLPAFLDNFLDSIANSSLIALPLILITLFIILDIAISIIMKIVFGKSSRGWIAKMEERIVLIEQGLTLFVCNLMIGFINLLLFIPDFFNHIGQLLLDENDFFPQEKIEINKFLRGKENPPPDGCIHDGMESAGKGAANEDKR